MIRIYVIALIASVALLGSTSSCTQDKAVSLEIAELCDTTTYNYTNDIAPILQASCANGIGPGTGCHDSWISNYASVKFHVNNGNFDYRVLQLKDMPVPGNSFGIPPLTQAELTKLQCWILTGAPED